MALNMEKKRILLSDLHSDVTEDDIKERFGKFGEINSVQIKKSFDDDQKTVAFVDMTAMPNSLKKCLTTFGKAVWKGKVMKLEIVNDSVFDRLKHEREPRNIEFVEAKDNELKRDRKSRNASYVKANDNESCNMQPVTFLNKKLDANSVHVSGLPKFKGLSILKKNTDSKKRKDLKKSKNLEVSETENVEEIVSSNNVSLDFMEKLEMFSENVWGGDGTFEVVKEDWKPNKLPANDVRPTKKERKISFESRPVISKEESSNKHHLSNEKRLHSLQMKQSTGEIQQQIIKEALSKVSAQNKKVFFTVDDENEDQNDGGCQSGIRVEEVDNENDADEAIDCKPDFNESKEQFETNERSRNDDRSKGDQSSGNNEIKKKKHWTEFVSERYNPISKDHTKYELTRQHYDLEKQPKKKFREEKETKKGDEEEDGKKVSGKCFFEVADGLPDVFNKKSDKSFSLMELFSSNQERKSDLDKNFERESAPTDEGLRTNSYGKRKWLQHEPSGHDEGSRNDSYGKRKWSQHEPSDRDTNFEPINSAVEKKFSHTTSKDITDLQHFDRDQDEGTFFLFAGDARLKEGVKFFRRSEDLTTVQQKWERKKEELRSFWFDIRKKTMAEFKKPNKKAKNGHVKGKTVKKQGKYIPKNKHFPKK